MAQPLTRLLRQLRHLSASPEPASDADLIGRFVRRRDEEAFAALVERHGPMVLNACRRVLGDVHAAEDAFQAVFLVLARKAATLSRPEALAGWLYGVASRVALKARRGARPQERLAGASELTDPSPDPLAEVSARDLLATLEREVQRLPQAYRLAVVLCCLEGLSQEEAAHRLGCTPAALRGRLERGRKRLHRELDKRGLSLSGALGVAEVARLTGGVPAALRSGTAGAAATFAAGQTAGGAINVQAAALAEGVLRAMFLSRVKIAVVALLTTVVAGTALGVLGLEAKPPAPAVAGKPKPGKDKADAATREKIRKLQVERREALKQAEEARLQEFLAGRGTLDLLLKISRLLLQAELDLAATAQQRIAAHAAHLKVAKEVDQFCEQRYHAGRMTPADFFQARAARLEAEIGWLKAGGKDEEEKDGKGKDRK
jgi:RNA polymerase sigma factor (sigma-70 family)